MRDIQKIEEELGIKDPLTFNLTAIAADIEDEEKRVNSLLYKNET